MQADKGEPADVKKAADDKEAANYLCYISIKQDRVFLIQIIQ
jgi:hypothetical protein